MIMINIHLVLVHYVLADGCWRFARRALKIKDKRLQEAQRYSLKLDIDLSLEYISE